MATKNIAQAKSIKDAKISLLDLNPGSILGSTLQGIFGSCLNLDIQLQEVSIGAFDLGVCERELSGIISRFNPDVIFLISSSTHLKRLSALIQSMSKEPSEVPVIVVTEGGKPDEMVDLLKMGASDFITPPLRSIDVLPRLWRLLEQKRRADRTVRTLKEKIGLKQLVGEDPVFLTEINKIPLVAKCDASILISGETGTGKELCARAIHYLGPRAGKPFIPVNCGAIPLELVENELFGHVRGAFTGAFKSQPGLIHEANGGTLFLDEVNCLPLLAQVKFMRFLQDREYKRLGSAKIYRADVRVIAATNLDSEQAIREGSLRQDLYYRLSTIPLMLPPLRERKEDIPILTRHFLEKYGTELNRQVTGFAPDAMQKLVSYEWPGNVRELENIIERAVLFSKYAVITGNEIILPGPKAEAVKQSFKEAKANAIAKFERAYIQGLLLAYQGNITKAAQAAQKNRRAFWQLIRKYKIDVQNFKSGSP